MTRDEYRAMLRQGPAVVLAASADLLALLDELDASTAQPRVPCRSLVSSQSTSPVASDGAGAFEGPKRQTVAFLPVMRCHRCDAQWIYGGRHDCAEARAIQRELRCTEVVA